MKMPTTEEIDIAVMWLESNDGDREREACRKVARWIEHQNLEAFLRIEARRAGLPLATVRRKWKEGSTL